VPQTLFQESDVQTQRGLIGEKEPPARIRLLMENSQAEQMCLRLFMSHLVLCTSVCQQQLGKPPLSADINGDDPPRLISSVANSMFAFRAEQLIKIAQSRKFFTSAELFKR
jgi:hypothetical protein